MVLTRYNPSTGQLLIVGEVTAPPEVVPPYEPDGADHSLHCDPKYTLLLQCAELTKNTFSLSHAKVNALLERAENKESFYQILSALKEDYETNHKYKYFMNSMQKEEYETMFRRRYLALDTKYQEFVRKQKARQPTLPTPEHRDDDWSWKEPDEQTKRMQNISEYGW